MSCCLTQATPEHQRRFIAPEDNHSALSVTRHARLMLLACGGGSPHVSRELARVRGDAVGPSGYAAEPEPGRRFPFSSPQMMYRTEPNGAPGSARGLEVRHFAATLVPRVGCSPAAISHANKRRTNMCPHAEG